MKQYSDRQPSSVHGTTILYEYVLRKVQFRVNK
jgi:hypothetical protein